MRPTATTSSHNSFGYAFALVVILPARTSPHMSGVNQTMGRPEPAAAVAGVVDVEACAGIGSAPAHGDVGIPADRVGERSGAAAGKPRDRALSVAGEVQVRAAAFAMRTDIDRRRELLQQDVNGVDGTRVRDGRYRVAQPVSCADASPPLTSRHLFNES